MPGPEVTIRRLEPPAGYEQLLRVADRRTGLRAVIAIHSTALGPAFGGCRMRAYSSQRAASRDALRLARAMSYKAALAGLPYGGGKCVVIGDPATAKTDGLLTALGRAVDRLGGRYLTADDVGTTVRDMEVLRRVTPHARGLPDAEGEPCPAAAYGTFLAIQAAVRHRLRRPDLAGVTVAVQGLGSVGFRLCGYLHEAGAVLRVSDLRPDLVERACRAFGAVGVPAESVLFEEVDVLSPNALGDVFDDHTVPRLGARIVAGAANNQLKVARQGVALHERGILYVPDYVANVGGLIDVAMEGPGYSHERVLRACEAVHDTTLRVLHEAERAGAPTSSTANRMAEARLRFDRLHGLAA